VKEGNTVAAAAAEEALLRRPK